MIQTIIVYVGIVLAMGYFFNLSQKYSQSTTNRNNVKSIAFFLCAIFIFSIIFGMRYYVGIDYPMYKYVYESNDYHVDRYEWFVYWITTTCSRLDMHYAVYFGILAFIQCLFYFLAYWKEKQIMASLIAFLILSGEVQQGWMNGIRQYCAICIFVFAVSMLVKRSVKYVLIFYLLLFVAYGFHRSAIIFVFVPLYIFLNRKYLFNNIPIQYILLVLLFVGQIFNIKSSYLNEIDYYAALLSYENYADAIQHSGGKLIGVFDYIHLFMYFFIIYHSDKVKKFYSNTPIFQYTYDFAILGIYLNYFFAGSMMLIRIVQYFYIFLYPLFAFYFFYFYKNVLYGKGFFYRNVIVLYFVLSLIRVLASMTTNTTQFVFFFQDDLCHVKEMQRNKMFNRTVN